MAIEGITEQDIANYLLHTPGFFERHAELLHQVQITSPHGARAVSLQERQIEMLRERIKGLEHKIVEMIRHGQENVAIADRLHRWTRAVLTTAEAKALPGVMVAELKHQYLIPQAAIRIWGADGQFSGEAFSQAVSEDVKSFTTSLSLPYCGVNAGFEAATWLDDPGTVMSIAMLPLRAGRGADNTVGLLVLGSPDPTRYTAEMGTEFLMRISELAGAALTRLLPAR
jgi:uncharacterized protein